MTNERGPAQCLAHNMCPTKRIPLISFRLYSLQVLWLLSQHLGIKTTYLTGLFPPLDYNGLKDKGHCLCIFVVLGLSKEPGSEMLHAQLWWLTHGANEARVLNLNLAALACYSNDFAILAYCTLLLPSQMPTLNDPGGQVAGADALVQTQSY